MTDDVYADRYVAFIDILGSANTFVDLNTLRRRRKS
jgi:hypothetical protein